MRIWDSIKQGEMSWLSLRAGIVTASECSVLFTPLWKLSDGKGVDSYVAQKLAEKWLGASETNSFMSKRMEDGHLREDEGRKAYQFQYDVDVSQVAFIASDDLRVGCSPDGLVGNDCGLELKCPAPEAHVKYLLANVVPADYIHQVHFSMYATGFSRWVFVSHRPGFPLFVKVVNRDEKIMETIEEGVDNFYLKLDTAYKCLVGLNAGMEPDKNTLRESVLQMEKPKKPEPKPEQPETFDNIP